MSKPPPTIAGIEEEVRLMKLDAQEPPLPGQPKRRGMKIGEWINARMKDAAARALN